MSADDALIRFPGLAWQYIAALTSAPTPPAPCGFCGASTHEGCELCAREDAERAPLTAGQQTQDK
jgi:hypothetical protein